jgi:hypothetical protein
MLKKMLIDNLENSVPPVLVLIKKYANFLFFLSLILIYLIFLKHQNFDFMMFFPLKLSLKMVEKIRIFLFSIPRDF